MNDENANNKIIFLTDGEGLVSIDILKEAREKGIVIHTVSLGSSVGSNIVLSVMAEFTGGQYLKAITPDELVNIYGELGESALDTTDTDGDGLLDGEEINPTPSNIPWDDFEELMEYFGNEYLDADYPSSDYYFVMNSNPKEVDSDGDGYSDGDEVKIYNTPSYISNVKEYSLSSEYVQILYEGEEKWANNTNNLSYGGNQSWF